MIILFQLSVITISTPSRPTRSLHINILSLQHYFSPLMWQMCHAHGYVAHAGLLLPVPTY